MFIGNFLINSSFYRIDYLFQNENLQKKYSHVKCQV